MRFISLILIIVISGSYVDAQERRLARIPDISGYQTLICDFHLHTVFSDGLVWPTVRVDEAWNEGLDAIAITDHLEYLPHEADIRTNHNRSWQIAEAYAKKRDIILIPGTEITKGMPPGHFNAIFIKDANPILNDNYLVSIKEAVSQGAFIMWNHPGWKAQQPDTMKWWDEHTELYNLGYLHGIEVANESEYYPAAINWATDRKLTILGNSDQHAAFLGRNLLPENHRTCTFVFVKERSIEGIKEALFNQRSIAYIDKTVMGEESLLGQFFLESIEKRRIEGEGKRYSLINDTDLPIEILLISEDGKWTKAFSLDAGHEYFIELPERMKEEDILIEVSNFLFGNNQKLLIPFISLVPVDK